LILGGLGYPVLLFRCAKGLGNLKRKGMGAKISLDKGR